MKPTFKKWIIANAIGGLISYIGAIILAIIAFASLFVSNYFIDLFWWVLIFTIPGLTQGALLGFIQSRVLKNKFNHFIPSDWTLRTMIAGGLCWGIVGSNPILLGATPLFPQWPEYQFITYFTVAIPLLLGGVIGFLQGGLLKPHGLPRWKWTLGNVLGRMIGFMLYVVIASRLTTETQTLTIALLPLGILILLLDGLVLGTVTWYLALRDHLRDG